MTVLLLASASPARLAVLQTAGLDPLVTVSGVDEDAVLDRLRDADPETQIQELAEAKADAVAVQVSGGVLPGVPSDDVVVVGCDSMLLIDGELQGKPAGVDQAKARWRQMAGRDAVLITGHAVRRVMDGRVAAGVAGTRSTVVRMGRPTDGELDAYIATGEPMAVAGALTIDGFGGWFVEGVDGDPSNVLGISLPLTRELLRRVGVRVTDLWRDPARTEAAPETPSARAPHAPSARPAKFDATVAPPVRAAASTNGARTADTLVPATDVDSPTHRST